MPGVYTSFIKAGRVTVPVELHFIPSKVFDDITGKENLSSKWAALKHWREIKDMLKPAVEAAIKYNNDLTGAWEKYTGQPNFASRNSTAIGYVYEANKGKFTDVMDPKDTWTDDDDEEDDENSGMRDYGGRFNKFPPTKVYLRACALMRTPSCSKKDDEKKITKELGVKPDAYHSFFQPHNQNHETSPSCSSSNKKRKSSVYASSDLRKNATSTNTLNGASMNQTSGYRELEPMSSTSSMEYVDNDQFNPMGFGRSPASSTSLDDFTQRNGMSNEAQIDNDDDLWALRGTFYEEKDDEDNEDSMGLYGYSANLHSTNNSMLDDEDEESLPDIDCTPVSLPPVINSPTKGTNTGLSKPSKKSKKRDSGGLGSGKTKNSKRQKLSDELVENAQPLNNKKKSEELPNGRLSFDKEFLNGTSIPNSLSTKKNTKKGTGAPLLGKKDKNNFFDSLTNTDGTSSKKNRRRKGKNEGKRKSPDIFGNIPGSINKKTRANTSGKRKDKEASILVTRKERRNSDVHNNANRSVLIEKVSTLNTPLTGRVLSVKEADKLSRSPQKEKEKDASTQSRIPELPEVLINAEDLRKEIGADKYGAVFNNSLDYNNPKFITITTSAPTLSSSLSSTKTSETLTKSHKTPVPTAGCSSSQKKSNNNTTPKVQRSLRPKRKSKLSFSSDTKEKDSQSQTPATSSLKSIEKSSSYSPSSVNTNASALSTTETRKFTERPVSALDACLKSLALKTAAERKDYADNEGIGSSFGLSPSSIFNSKLQEPGSGNPRSVIDVMNSTRKLSKNSKSIDSDAESVVLLKQTEKRRRRRDRQKKLVVKQERQDSPVHSNNFLNNASFKSSASAPNSPFEIDPEMPVLVMQVTPEEFLRRSSPTPVLSSNVPAPVLQLEGSIKNNSHNSPSPSEANNRIQTRKTKLSQTIFEPKLIPVNSSPIFTVPLTATTSGSTLDAIPTTKTVQPQASQPLSPTKSQPAPTPSKLPTIKKPKPVKSTGGNKKPESYKNPTRKPKSFRSSSVSRAKRYSRRLTDKTKNDISTTRDNLSGLPTAIKDTETEASLLSSQPEVLSKDKLLPASLIASNAAFQPIITEAEQTKSIALSPSASVSYLQQSESSNSNNHIRDRDSSERDLSQNSSAELRKSQSTGLAAIQEAYASDSDDEHNSVVNSSSKQVNINVGSEYYTLDLNRDGEFQLQELGANVIDEFISPADDSDMATFNSISIPYEENSDNEDLFSFDMENSGGNTIQIVINNDGSANTNVIVPGDCSNDNALTAEEIPTFVLVGSRVGSPESSPAFSPVGSPVGSPVVSPVVSPPGSPVGYSEDRSLVLYHVPPPSLSFDNTHRSISPAPEQELNMPPPMFRPPRTPQKNKANAKLPVAAVSQRLAIPRRSAPASPGQKRALAAVGVEVHPSRLSTLEIATNPHFFNAGIELCNQLVSNQTDVKEIRRKIFHETKSSSSIRSSSPDITLLCSVKKARKQREELEASNSQQRKSKLKIKQEDEKNRKGSEEEDRLNVSSDVHEGGVALIKELVSRTETISSQSRSYEPKGDEYDLSQRSLCMLNLFPEYDKKSRKYKQNTKNVQELSDDRIKNYFNLILPTLKDVSNGTLESTRRHLCREVPVSRAKLSQLNAISPFTNAQGNLLATLIEEKFQCCPDDIDSANYTDYLSYVMLPETAIRIYAVVNKMTYDEAEQEMIHGATCVNSY